ncbi:hypothetical protein MRX96_018657 [Rhipicephalus microplus]
MSTKRACSAKRIPTRTRALPKTCKRTRSNQCKELHHESIMDVIWLIKSRPQHRVGCTDHAEMLTAKMVAFFITTRLHFFVKSLNRARMQKRETAKYLKLSRCT